MIVTRASHSNQPYLLADRGLPRRTTPDLSIRRTPGRNSATRREAYLLQLFRCNPDRAVQWNAGTRQQCRERISLISTGVRQETTLMNGTASLARKDEGQVLPRVLVAILQAGLQGPRRL